MTHRVLVPLVALLLLPLIANQHSRADTADDAAAIFADSGLQGGLVVHLGSGDGQLSQALKKSEAFQVQGLERDGAKVSAARQSVLKTDAYGEVSFQRFAGSELPYVDNLVNLIVVDDLGDVTMDEVQRVLVPNGIVLVRAADGSWEKTVKPRPDNIDEWSHYLHDPSGNSVADDDVVAPPRHLQWVGSPRWSRHHDRMASMSALVSTGGRIFYIMDEGSRVSIQLPPKWKLIARDAFNGTVLWKKDIVDWQSHLWPLKSGPTQLARRLVSSGDTVFATLGFNAPLAAIDAASGKTLRTYEGSDATEEIIHTNGKLFLVVRKGKAELADYAPLFGTVGDQARSRTDFFFNEEPRVIMAFEADTGELLWSKLTRVSPLTLAADAENVFFHDGEKVVGIDQQSGDVAWQSELVTRRQSFTFNFGPRLVVHKDVVLYSGGDNRMKSLDAKSGKELWGAEFPNSGYQSPQDLMVVDGLVWLAPLTSGRDSGVYTGRDPRSGEVKKQFAPDVETYWFHHRCYIAKGTKNFLMPSRTGIEFVDPDEEHWDINHWVRGGCLYGVMPCNGLTYAPPHDCACYPEAKLYGFNALAPLAPTRPIPAEVPEEGRLFKGPAYGSPLTAAAGEKSEDWPTYRHDKGRTGAASSKIETAIGEKWTTDIGGRLTSPVIASGHVYVARIDQHTLYALNEADGKEDWTFTAGARIDSPPTVHRGRVVFGAADGWVYCLQASDGQLVWSYRAAPLDRRTMAYEQLESLWPVHGSVLIREDKVYCVAGRSNFLDGGLRLLQLELETGEKLVENIMDETNPETGNNLQEKLQILQMPVGLPDILSSDGEHLYMKSQKFDFDGKRLEIGPNSGDFVGQVQKQRGPGAHLFAPMGFLDDSWFHRSYWVMGQSFAGGHGGYYQAGRFAPSGRLMVVGDGYVYGYGRKPQYLRWTTVLEHQLFATSSTPPEIPEDFGKPAAAQGGTYAQFPKSPKLNPAGKPITIEAWMTATKPAGTIVARGGPAEGFALTLQVGKPVFHVRSGGELTSITGPKRIVGGWHHVVGVLNEDLTTQLYVDGELAAKGKAKGLLKSDPAQGMEVGVDGQSAVGLYKSPFAFTGIIDEVRLYFDAFDAKAIAARYDDGDELGGDPMLVVSFDDGSARDLSIHRNNGTLFGGKQVEGQTGRAIQFTARKGGGNKNNRQGNSLVNPKWANDVPIYVRAMVLSGPNLFVAGPPDMIDEEQTFELISKSDPNVEKLLSEQDDALLGKQGAMLIGVDIATGTIQNNIPLKALPAWDGMAGANGRLFLSTLDGKIHCYGN